mgnify:CR=1 FL=1
MNKIITLFHGSEKVIEAPSFGEGKRNNDFGLGFYCTETEKLAKEWAVSSLRDGFCNRYTLDTEYMKILNLNSPDYTILNWIAVLVEHRLFSIRTPIARRAKKYLIDNFDITVSMRHWESDADFKPTPKRPKSLSPYSSRSLPYFIALNNAASSIPTASSRIVIYKLSLLYEGKSIQMFFAFTDIELSIISANAVLNEYPIDLKEFIKISGDGIFFILSAMTQPSTL